MSVPHIVVLGAGAAGLAAARTLVGRQDVTITLIGRTGETPYTRMHIKQVAVGLTPPERIHTPLPPVTYRADTVRYIDPSNREVRLASGSTVPFDALIIATGSGPRTLTAVPGADHAQASGNITALHSLTDAIRIRNVLPPRPRRAHIAIYGGGLTAAETASMLHAAGHGVTLISRSTLPGLTTFGPVIAEHLAHEHRRRIATFYDGTITAITTTLNDRARIHLENETRIDADLLIVALGTLPHAPSPWSGPVGVDEYLRTGTSGVYAAGGVALHRDPQLGTWRIDH